MRLLQKLAAGFLVSLGSLFLLMAILMPFDKTETPEKRQDAILGGLVLGIPMTAGGGLIIWNLSRTRKKQQSDRLQSIFYQSLKQNQGRISLVQFAMAAELPGDDAKVYLDEKAVEFSANFEVDENGGIFYRFPFIPSIEGS